MSPLAALLLYLALQCVALWAACEEERDGWG